MSIKEFILSDNKWHRLGRHLFFWFLWGGYFTMTRYLNPIAYQMTGHFPNFWKTSIETFFFLFPQMFLVYPALYFILPKFVFTQKYILAFFWFIVFYFVAMTVNAVYLIYVPWAKIIWVPNANLFLTTSTFTEKLFYAYLGSILGSITALSISSSFKLFKHYYLKSIRNEQLQKENSDAQLRLLLAQVQPHFMFNTLNNIYSQAQEESPKSAKMILELSHILRYVLDEGKKKRVPLENELEMIVDYLNLEKIRYDNKLDLHFVFPSNTDDITIAPLILLPLVENCFKHGASKMINNPWINIKSELTDNKFSIKLMNGKINENTHEKSRKGTGIENIRRRLNLIYPHKHIFEIKDDDETFIVNLQIVLDHQISED
ncbi:sensor histidine kinase [Aestuariibaculum lutulentum]|uniref:Histidine kinase n=1 Tax=Aestuariibaculum lutulentum TaxID=2920935 RepID=A0ABS9RDN9_9FLAO|nr:histidine kinase [Aestuariibaculum lutulentum]MCH4551057.1 histidine kinase [Aestuariibaculum lutulentum]